MKNIYFTIPIKYNVVTIKKNLFFVREKYFILIIYILKNTYFLKLFIVNHKKFIVIIQIKKSIFFIKFFLSTKNISFLNPI